MWGSLPSAIKIVTILAIVNGIILLVGGLITIYFIPTIITSQLRNITNLTEVNQLHPQISSGVSGTILSIIYIIALVSIALGGAWFCLAWSMYDSKQWAWLTTVILSIITIIFSILSIGDIVNITTLIISGLILYYMYRPYVKSYFGRVTIPK
jgi:hypothetical protein